MAFKRVGPKKKAIKKSVVLRHKQQVVVLQLCFIRQVILCAKCKMKAFPRA